MTTLPVIPLAGPASPCLQHACSRCCHDTEMLLTRDDVDRIAVSTTLEPSVFSFTAEDGFVQLRTRAEPPVPGHEGAPCFFLARDGRCGIHADRPEGCRLYPAVWDSDLRRAVLDIETCPHTAGFRLGDSVAGAVAALVGRLVAERDAREHNDE